MNTAKQIREPRADYLALEEPALLRGFELLATAEGGVTKLRELILSLAVQGKLVTQDTSNETAEALLLRLWKHHPETSARHALSRDALAAPYQLPDTWTWAALGDLVESMGSGWSPACDEGKRIDGRRWAVLRTTAVQVMEYRPDEHKALPLKLTPRPEIEVKRGDILITRAGPMNRVGISCAVNETPPRLMLSDKIVRFHPISDELLPAFVVLALNAGWSREQLEQAKTGMAASQVNISQARIKKVLVPICGTTEQHRIVARVEELMTLCDELEARGRLADEQHTRLITTLFDALTTSDSAQTLADNWQRIATHFDLLLDRPQAIDALEQTILQLAVRGLLVAQDASDEPASALLTRIRVEKNRLVTEGKTRRDKPVPPVSDESKPFEVRPGWEWAPFGTLVNVSSGITLGRKTTPAKPITLPYLRVANVQRWHLDLDHLKTITVAESELPHFLLKPGDLLLTEGGDWDKVGRTCIWQGDIELCLHQNHVFKARGVLPEWSPAWAELYLNSTDARTFFAGASKQTTNLASINSTQLKSCPFPVPPLAEQQRIVARIEHLRHLCADLRERLNKVRATQTHFADTLVTEAVHPQRGARLG